MTLLIATFALTLLVSFTCSLLESAFLSTTSAYIAVLVRDRKRSGILLEHLKENVNRPLASILTLNTIANTFGSAAVAYEAQSLYGNDAVTIFTVMLTFMILFFSEIIPKSLGATFWRQLAPFTGYLLQGLVLALYPIVYCTEFVTKLFRNKNGDEPELSREEILMTAEIGAEEGSIKSKESNIIKNLLMLDKIFVYDIMTPRSVVFALADDYTVDEVFEKYKPLRFSRIPVYHETLDNIIGMTFRYKIHDAQSNDLHDKKISEITVPITSLPERMTVQQALDFFIKDKEHIALAVDDYGIVTGIVTLEDAIETLLGVEIVDELDSVPDMRKYALEQWQQRKQKIRRS